MLTDTVERLSHQIVKMCDKTKPVFSLPCRSCIHARWCKSWITSSIVESKFLKLIINVIFSHKVKNWRAIPYQYTSVITVTSVKFWSMWTAEIGYMILYMIWYCLCNPKARGNLALEIYSIWCWAALIQCVNSIGLFTLLLSAALVYLHVSSRFWTVLTSHAAICFHSSVPRCDLS